MIKIAIQCISIIMTIIVINILYNILYSYYHSVTILELLLAIDNILVWENLAAINKYNDWGWFKSQQ